MIFLFLWKTFDFCVVFLGFRNVRALLSFFISLMARLLAHM